MDIKYSRQKYPASDVVYDRLSSKKALTMCHYHYNMFRETDNGISFQFVNHAEP